MLACEQERKDVQQAPQAWVESLPRMDMKRLVFIYETWTSTSMTRRCGRAPKGKRCTASARTGTGRRLPLWVHSAEVD